MKSTNPPGEESGFTFVPVGADMQAAIALGRQARRHQEQIAARTAPADLPRHLLIEGVIDGLYLNVAMPDGSLWHYRHNLDLPDGRTLLVCIDMSEPTLVRIFTPSAEGLHPYAGEGIRFGVERRVA